MKQINDLSESEADMRAKKRIRKSSPVEVTPEERYHLINDAAYFRSLQQREGTGQSKDEAEAWCEVASEIDALLKQHGTKT